MILDPGLAIKHRTNAILIGGKQMSSVALNIYYVYFQHVRRLCSEDFLLDFCNAIVRI